MVDYGERACVSTGGIGGTIISYKLSENIDDPVVKFLIVGTGMIVGGVFGFLVYRSERLNIIH